MKRFLKQLLQSRGFSLSRLSECDVVPKGNPRCSEATTSLYEITKEFLLPSLPPLSESLLKTLTLLEGISVSQALYLIDSLHQTRSLEGAVLEMGVAQGSTSRMIAQEILSSKRDFWLFDSFKGLPAPTSEDVLIDDISGFGNMDAYEGAMEVSRNAVEDKLCACKFPSARTHIVEGYFDENTIVSVDLPSKVSFAFVDFDLYRPIRDALAYLSDALEDGGHIIVHDYGFFSTGPQQAVDEFMAKSADKYNLRLPHKSGCGIAILEKDLE